MILFDMIKRILILDKSTIHPYTKLYGKIFNINFKKVNLLNEVCLIGFCFFKGENYYMVINHSDSIFNTDCVDINYEEICDVL